MVKKCREGGEGGRMCVAAEGDTKKPWGGVRKGETKTGATTATSARSTPRLLEVMLGGEEGRGGVL